jgi:chromosomal replication initiator protein
MRCRVRFSNLHTLIITADFSRRRRNSRLILRLEYAPKERLMATREMDVVGTVRSVLAQHIGKDRYDLWFSKLARIDVAGENIVVAAQTPFVQDWIRKHLGRELRLALQAAFPTSGDAAISFTLMDCSHPQREPCSGVGMVTADEDRHETAVSASGPFNPTGSKGYERRFESMETFVVGEENRSAMTAAKLAAERPGQASPLLIYGPTATGKTHLLEGIRTAFRRCHPQLRVICLTAEQFTSGYVEAARRRELPSFRAKFRFVDCLLIDDVHFLAGKVGTVGELLYTVDSLMRGGRQIVLTADRAPAELGEIGEELLSRISAGLVAVVDPPGYETRLGIAQRTAHSLGFRVPAEVLSAVAMQVTSHCRAVIGAINRLYAHSLTSGNALSREDADVILAEIAQQNTPSVRLTDIERAVCNVFGVDAKSLRSGRRARAVSDPRTLAMWLARKYTRAALGEIGTYFGRRSHSTVISAGRKVEKWLSGRMQIAVGNRNCTADEAIRRIERALRRA